MKIKTAIPDVLIEIDQLAKKIVSVQMGQYNYESDFIIEFITDSLGGHRAVKQLIEDHQVKTIDVPDRLEDEYGVPV